MSWVYFVLCFGYLKKCYCPETLSLVINDSSFIFHSIVEVEYVLLISREDKWSYTFSCDIQGIEENLHLYIFTLSAELIFSLYQAGLFSRSRITNFILSCNPWIPHIIGHQIKEEE